MLEILRETRHEVYNETIQNSESNVENLRQ